MSRKKKEETLQEVLEQMADECRGSGQNNLAIVLYSYLGAEKCGMDTYFAKHCQEFAVQGIKKIEKFRAQRNN